MIASRNRHRAVWDDRRASFQVIPLPCENGTDPGVDYGMSNHPHHCSEYQPGQHKANYDAEKVKPHDFFTWQRVSFLVSFQSLVIESLRFWLRINAVAISCTYSLSLHLFHYVMGCCAQIPQDVELLSTIHACAYGNLVVACVVEFVRRPLVDF